MDLLLAVLAIGLHELAHGVVAAAFGARVEQFVIGMPPLFRRLGRVAGVDVWVGKAPLGFAVGIRDEDFWLLSRRQAVAVWLAGPIVNLALAPLFLAAGHFWAAFLTLNLGITNLLPIPPLDGGQAVLGVFGASPETRQRLGRIGLRALLGATAALAVVALVIQFS